MDFKPVLSAEHLYPRDQAKNIDTNVECSICFNVNIPSDNKDIGSTECT